MNNLQGFSFEEKQLLRATIIPYEETNRLENFYPITMCSIHQHIVWRELHHTPFTAAFFSDTLATQAIEQRRICITPFSVLQDLFPNNPNSPRVHSLEPSGFIFHTSRCGSTLITQMLASLDSCIVMSEPPILDAVFRFLHVNPQLTGKEALIKQLIDTLGRQRSSKEKHFFIKFDSWHVAWIPLIRKIYPHTPIVFLYREPAQVLASHQKQRGPQMIPHFVNLSALQPNTSDIHPSDLDAYCLRMQLSFYQTVLAYIAEFAHLKLDHTTDYAAISLINYSQLPHVMWEKLTSLFSMHLSEVEIHQIIARASFHSKNPQQSFTKDTYIKTNHPEYEQTQKSYLQLEEFRISNT